MSPLNKSFLALFIAMALALAAWGIQTAQDSRASRFVRGCLWSIALGIIVLLVALTTHFAHAHDDGQWQNSNPAVREWYQSLMRPDAPTSSCCGEADAYWADEIHVRNGRTYATITDDRDDAPLHRPHVDVGTEIEIPNNKLKWDRSNPTGHGIVFMSRENFVFCFVQPPGA